MRKVPGKVIKLSAFKFTLEILITDGIQLLLNNYPLAYVLQYSVLLIL
jgi:hypothetical protein